MTIFDMVFVSESLNSYSTTHFVRPVLRQSFHSSEVIVVC